MIKRKLINACLLETLVKGVECQAQRDKGTSPKKDAATFLKAILCVYNEQE